MSLHTSNAGKIRSEVLHDGHGFGRSRDFASGLVFWLCLTLTPSFRARFPQCPKLVDDLNAERMRNGSKYKRPGTWPVCKVLHAIHKLLVCEAVDGVQTLYHKTWLAMNSCGLARVGNAGGEFGIGFGVDATKKEEIFDALRVEFAPAAAFFVELHDRKAHHKDCSCVLKEGQTATFEIIPMGRTHAYGFNKVWDVKLQRYVTVKAKKDGGPGFYYNAFINHKHPFNKLLVALANETGNEKNETGLRKTLGKWRENQGVLLSNGYPLGLTIKEGDEVIHKFIRTHG